MKFNAFVEGQSGSGVGSHDVVCGLVQMKLEGPGNSEGKVLPKDGNKITAGRVQVSNLDNGQQDWPLRIDHEKNGSFNWEPQLLGSDEKNSELCFSYVAIDGIIHSEQSVKNAIEQSLMVGQCEVSTAKEVFLRKISTSEAECEMLHVHKVELGDYKLLIPSKTSDLEMNMPNDGARAKSLCI